MLLHLILMKAPKFLLRVIYLLVMFYLCAITGNAILMMVRAKIARPDTHFSGDAYLHIAGMLTVVFLLSFLFRWLGPQDRSPQLR